MSHPIKSAGDGGIPARRLAGFAAAIAAVTFLLYAPVAGFEFLNFDDDEYVTANPFVQSGLSARNVRLAFTLARGGHYHPVTWISHMADVSLFGLRPGPAHLENAALHATTTALVFLLAGRCLAAPWLAAVIALLFGLHPTRIESVAWIAERKDVLSVLFALLALHAWVGFTRRPRAARYLLVIAPFLVGLLCKPTLAPLPVLLLLFDRWPLARDATWRRLVVEKVPLFALAAAAVVVTAITQARAGAIAATPDVAPGDRVATAAVAYLAYLGKFFWPAGLGIFYPLPRYAPGIGAGAVIALAALSFLALAGARARPALAFGWLWFLVAPLPVIGLVQFGGQAFADRWTYLPHLGLAFGIVYTGHELLAARARTAAAALAVIACVAVTAAELPNWRTSETIFRRTLDVAPDNFMAHTNLGSALDAAGRLDEAAPHYEEAARLNPTWPEAQNNLGTLRARQGRVDEAEAAFRRALAVRPSMLLARYNLGLAESQSGRPLAAVTDWLIVLGAEPRHALARRSLRFVVERELGPACDSNGLRAAPEDAAALAAALAAWRPDDPDEESRSLRDALGRIAACAAPR